MSQATLQYLHDHPFLAGMEREQLNRMMMWSHRVLFRAGNPVFREGNAADRFWLIREGHVAIQAKGSGEEPVVIETLGPGSVLGWSWLLPPRRWHFAAVAQDKVVALEFDAVAVNQMCATDTQLAAELYRRFLHVVVDRLHATRDRMLDLTARSKGATR